MPRLATADVVDRDALLAFVRPRHHVLLGSHRRDGRLQLSPGTAGVDAAGRLVVATSPQRAKTANARRDPRGTAVVLSDGWDGAWVQLEGTFEVLDVPEAVEPMVEHRLTAGQVRWRAAVLRLGKGLLRMTIGSWGPVATGGFPPELVPSG